MCCVGTITENARMCTTPWDEACVIPDSSEKFEYLHRGQCADSTEVRPDTEQPSLTACRDHCAIQVLDGYFAFSSSNSCICYTTYSQCGEDDSSHHDYNAYRIIYDFEFSLLGAFGTERVIISEGHSKVWGPLTLTTETTLFTVNSHHISIEFEDVSADGEDPDVFFRSSKLYPRIHSEELFERWGCDPVPDSSSSSSSDSSDDIDDRCVQVEEGDFRWGALYDIDFNAWCQTGIKGDSGDVCCGSGCGTCGGPGCSDRRGGEDMCCVDPIKDNDRKCETPWDEGCVIPERPKATCRLDSHCGVGFVCDDGACKHAPCERSSDCEWKEQKSCEKGDCQKFQCNRDNGECVNAKLKLRGEDCFLEKECAGSLGCLWFGEGGLKRCGRKRNDGGVCLNDGDCKNSCVCGLCGSDTLDMWIPLC